MGGLRQDRLGAQNVAGEELSSWGQRSRAALDQLHTQALLQIGDMLRHGRLADAQFCGRAGERAPTHKSCKSPEAGDQLHNYRLYCFSYLCIFILTSTLLRTPPSTPRRNGPPTLRASVEQEEHHMQAQNTRLLAIFLTVLGFLFWAADAGAQQPSAKGAQKPSSLCSRRTTTTTSS